MDFGAKRLGDDVLQVLDSFHLVAPVLVGHSLGGRELMAVISEQPDRCGGLVFIDSTIIDPNVELSALYEKLRPNLPSQTNGPSERTLEAYRKWQAWNGAVLPESEMRNSHYILQDGSIGRFRTYQSVPMAVRAGMEKMDFTRIHIPVLGFFAPPARLEAQFARYESWTVLQREALTEKYHAEWDFSKTASRTLKEAVPGATIVEIEGANHSMFLSNEADVLREMRTFLGKLR